MEFKNIRSRVCLLVVFCCFSWLVVAQTSDNNNRKLLLGEWVWEEASIADDKQPMTFDLYNDYYKFYSDIDIKENTVLLKNDGDETQNVKYEINGNFLGVEFPSGESYIAEWVILEDKLYLEFEGLYPFNASKKDRLLIIYKRK